MNLVRGVDRPVLAQRGLRRLLTCLAFSSFFLASQPVSARQTDKRRQEADFTLTDLQGKSWRLKALGGRIVLVNFWATWCPPCRKELPYLQGLYDRFKDQGLVILGISDEDASKLQPFVAKRNIPYPVLLDPQGKVGDLFQVKWIPKTFVYDRDGHLVGETGHIRNRRRLLKLLERAGLT